MNGGSIEYVASYIDSNYGQSGFTNDPSLIYGSRYFDVYPSNSSLKTYKNRILGDATGELGPFYYTINDEGTYKYYSSWNNSYSEFVKSVNPWFTRGGSYSSGLYSSQLYFNTVPGDAYGSVTFRIVLAS